MAGISPIDRTSIDAAIDAVMEQICDCCHYPYIESTLEEVLSGQCSACFSCPIEEKIRGIASLCEGEVVIAFGSVIVDSLELFFSDYASEDHPT